MKRICRLDVLAAAAILASTGCGPSRIEVGALVLQSLLPAVLVGAAIQWLYGAARRHLGPGYEDESFDLRPTRLLAVLAAGLWLLAHARYDLLELEAMTLGLAFAGTSYITVLAVALRLTAGRRPWFSWAPAVAFAYAAVPATWLVVFGGRAEASDAILSYFILPGYAGIVAGPLLAALFVEVGIRIHRRRRREEPPEPEFPEARIVE